MTAPATPPLVVGVDVGGTFTDVVVLDDRSGSIAVLKRPTVLHDQSQGIAAALDDLGVDGAAVQRLVHGTTTATNAVIERKGAPCAIVTTRGFRDVLELGRRERPHLYGLKGGFAPLIPQLRRLEVGGRIGPDGREVEPIDPDDLDRLVEELAALEVEAVGVTLLHSYANQLHEEQVAAAVQDRLPAVYVFRSSAIYPEVGEFERSSTTAIAAYVGPTVARYFNRLADELWARRHLHDFQVIQSNGGAMTYRATIRFPHATIKSGPAAGVVAAAAIATACGVDSAVSFDMGGTSADLALIVEERVARLVENSIGFRLPLHVPMLDISTLGAGGGSLASLDGAGVLQVGPESAGSDPGPACFARGGTRPTVADAHAHLGHLPLEALARNGVDAPSAELAADAIHAHVGQPLGISVDQAAEAILEVVNENMAGAIRLITVERGIDVRPAHLIAFGGAGPLHACALVRKLGMVGALVPAVPGLTSATGCLVSPLRHETARVVGRPLRDLTDDELGGLVDAQRTEGEQELASQGVDQASTAQHLTAMMLYEGQRHAVDVDVARPDVSVHGLRERFVARYRALYETPLDREIVVMSIRSSLSAPTPAVDVASLAPHAGDGGSPAGVREVKSWFLGAPVTYAVMDRATLPPGARVAGPAVVTQVDSTTLIEPGFTGTVRLNGTMLLEMEAT